MKIAVLPGDGIGPEIVAEAVKVLKALGPKFQLEEAPVGGAAYDLSGHPLPPATLELAKSADAILFGAVGDWKYDTLARELRPEQAILGLRKHLALFANFRPAICYPELTAASSLKPEIVGVLDILIVHCNLNVNNKIFPYLIRNFVGVWFPNPNLDLCLKIS
jgi:3-isopropylmalate dehydrogenase